MSDAGCILKRWEVRIRRGEFSEPLSSIVVAPSRGAALADTWRSDLFNGVTFKEFLGFARAYRDREPEWWGAPITVGGKPAHYLGHNSQYVDICWPGGKFALVSHPYDVLPIERRPVAYRDKAA